MSTTQELVKRDTAALAAQEFDGWAPGWLASLDLSEDTRLAYRVSLVKFVQWLAEKELTLADLDVEVIREWRDSLDGAAAATVNLRLTAVRSFLGWLKAQGLLAVNLAAEVKGRKRKGTTRSHRRDMLTNGEVGMVLATCDPNTAAGIRDHAILSLMAFCALRTVEVHRANVGDLSTKDERLVLWVHGKGHDEQDDFVVLPGAAERAVRHWLAVRPGKPGDPLFVSLSPRNAGERLSRAALRAMVLARYKAAGVVGAGETKSTHSLRHSAITNAIRHGATPMQAQALARHENLNTTMIYYHEMGRTTNPAEDLIDYD